MTVNKMIEGNKMIVDVEGRLDTVTAPDFEKSIKESLEGVTEIVIDFAGLSYISSAGLRALLVLQKTISAKGTMVLKNVSADVMDVFEITGFLDVLNIENEG